MAKGKNAQGKNIGLSIYEEDMVDIASAILSDSISQGTNIVLPNDFVCAKLCVLSGTCIDLTTSFLLTLGSGP